MNLNDIITEAKNKNNEECFNRFYYIIREYEEAEKVFNAWTFEINPLPGPPDPIYGEKKLRNFAIINKALRKWFLKETLTITEIPRRTLTISLSSPIVSSLTITSLTKRL